MASAGTVTLELDANSVKMIRELQKAQKQTKRTAGRMRKNMGGAFKAMAKSAALFGAALVAVTKISIDFADKIGKTADAVGLGIEEFQEFEFAAKRAGIETSQFASNMTAFVKRIGEAKVGMGPLVSGLKNLNPVLLENLKNAKNQGEALRLMADAIKATDSATERAALTNAAFSRAGVAMVNMLGKGAAGLNDMAGQARGLGVVMDENLVRKAEEAADKLGDLQRVLQVRVAETVIENADAIIDLADAVIGLVVAVGKAAGIVPKFMAFIGESIAAAIGGVALDDVIRMEDEIESLTRTIGGVELGFISGDLEAMRERRQLLIDAIKLQTEFAESQIIAADKASKVVVDDGLVPSSVPLLDPGEGARQAAKIEQIIADMMNTIKTFGMTDSDKALINLIDQGATEDQIVLFRQATEEMRLLKEAEERANATFEEIVVTAQRLPDVVQEAADEMSEFAIQAARSMQTAFADFLFDPFDEGLKGMLKGFSQMIQRMAAEAAAAAILKSLFGGFAGSGNSFLAALGAGFGGTRDGGGRGRPGEVYAITPRAGTELFVPDSAGTFIPNIEKLGGGSITNIINLPPTIRRDTAQQAATATSRVLKRASARNR